jgi:hypothetical protein
LCAACRSTLTPGASFCHRCGAAVGASVGPAVGAPFGAAGDRPPTSTLPWVITAAALVALVALVVSRTSSSGSGRETRGSDESAQTQPGEDRGPRGTVGSDEAQDANGGAVRAPDISTMSPRERADRLYDRVMRLSEEGKGDSVAFFAPMVVAAYGMLGPLDIDSHYDLGRVAEVTGSRPLARAEADTILRAHPSHLLGLTLAARVAVDDHRQSDAKTYYRRLTAAAPSELAKGLPEYEHHRTDIEEALSEAKKAGGTG